MTDGDLDGIDHDLQCQRTVERGEEDLGSSDQQVCLPEFQKNQLFAAVVMAEGFDVNGPDKRDIWRGHELWRGGFILLGK